MIYDANRNDPARWPGGSGVFLVALGLVGGCFLTNPQGDERFYEEKALVADEANVADYSDPQLVNPWGMAYGPETFFWVGNNGTGTSTLYSGSGQPQSDAVGGPVPLPAQGAGRGAPTGVVYNDSSGFEITSGDASGPSEFLFATEEGTILGWSPDVDERRAVIAVEPPADEAGYMGLAIARTGGRSLLYATNFRTGLIDVFDEDFEPAADLAENAFQDPDVPQGYRPFGIQNLDGRIYVTWVRADSDREEEVTGAGLGYVDVFMPDGDLIDTVATGGHLDAPWGMALAPSGFGQFSDALLIGNFGDGRITAFDADSYELLGQLSRDKDEPVVIEGLWALMFGNGRQAGNADELYYTAGPDDETHGRFGSVMVRK